MKRFSLLLLFVFCIVGMSQAQRTITGTVVDDTGEALIGANVIAVGTTVGASTDIDGTYTLTVPEGIEQVSISYTGYTTQVVDLGVSNVVDIVLTEGVLLDEAVVTALGIEKNKRKIGYAIENVSQEDIANTGEVDILRSLNAKVSGLSVVSSSGSPGASANIRIRGSASITGNNSPLFVIDGVPIDNSSFGNDVDGVDNANRVVDLNPNDIAEVSVLKGAAATATYGIRAANGVIIITTKKGSEGKPRVSINASYSVDRVNQLPERQSEWAQGRPSGGALLYRGPNTFEGFSWGPALADLEYDGNESLFNALGNIVPAGEGNGTAVTAFDPYDFFVDGNTIDLNASVSGGNEKAKYFISAGRTNVDGFMPNSSFARNSFRINTDFEVSDKFHVEASGNYVQSGGNRLQRGSNLRGVMLGLLRNTPTFDVGLGQAGQAAADNPETYLLDDGTQRSYRWGIYDNPYWVVNKNITQDNVNRIIGNVGFSYDVLDNLTVKYKLGVDQYTDIRGGHIDVVPDPFGTNWNNGSITNRDLQSTDINSDFFLIFSPEVSDDIGVNVTLGHNYFKQRLTDRTTTGLTLSQPGFFDISNAADISTDVDTRNRDLVGAFGILDFTVGDYLFPSLTVRNDWSSTLPSANNSFLSYSASLGFAFTELAGLDIPGVEYGKLRVSYGSVGLDAPVYSTTNYFNQSIIGGDGFLDNNFFPILGTNSFELSNQLPNSTLVPERTNTFEAGLEMQFARGRFGFDITYYNARSEDQIIPVDVSAATGFTTAVLNAGVVTNSGIELLVNFTPVKTENFKWDFNLNFTAMENDVEELTEGVESIGLAGFVSTSSRAIAGQPFGAIFGNGFDRDDNGNVLIGDDGFPIVDPVPQVLGDPIPDWTAGLRSTVTLFNDLSISALLDVRQGGDMWCGTCVIIDYFGTSKTSGDLRDQTVVFEGVRSDGSANTQEVTYADVEAGLGANYWVRYGFGGITEMSIYETSWIRLREVAVSYNLPANLLGGIGMENASIAISGRNLWLNTDYPGIDPETNLEGDSNGIGLDYFNNPNTKGFTVSFRTNF